MCYRRGRGGKTTFMRVIPQSFLTEKSALEGFRERFRRHTMVDYVIKHIRSGKMT